MSWSASLTTEKIQSIFEDEVKSAGGKITDSFDDDTLLFSRAVLPKNEKVARKDRVDKGVALKAAWEDIWVHPDVFRRVCINGGDRSPGRGDGTRNEHRTCGSSRDGN